MPISILIACCAKYILLCIICFVSLQSVSLSLFHTQSLIIIIRLCIPFLLALCVFFVWICLADIWLDAQNSKDCLIFLMEDAFVGFYQIYRLRVCHCMCWHERQRILCCSWWSSVVASTQFASLHSIKSSMHDNSMHCRRRIAHRRYITHHGQKCKCIQTGRHAESWNKSTKDFFFFLSVYSVMALPFGPVSCISIAWMNDHEPLTDNIQPTTMMWRIIEHRRHTYCIWSVWQGACLHSHTLAQPVMLKMHRSSIREFIAQNHQYEYQNMSVLAAKPYQNI